MDPCLAILRPPPSSCPPSGARESKNRVLGNRSPCPEAPPWLQSHCIGLLSHLSQSFLKTPGYSCSEDGHLLAHPGVPHRTCIHTGVPAQGGSQSKRHNIYTQDTNTGGGHFKGHRWSRELRAGAYSVFKHCPSGCLCGGGRGEQDIAQDGLPESSGIQEGLAGESEHQRAVVSGTGTEGQISQCRPG